MTPRIFDAHVHIERGLDGYDLDVAGKNVIFNRVEEYRCDGRGNLGPRDSATLILDIGEERAFVREEADAGRISAVKIHSRIQKIGHAKWPQISAALSLLPPHLAVVVDAFYFGADLEHQPSLPALVSLLQEFPERRFVVAHSGGYRMLEYFFHLREFTNVYYELALSLQYLQDSSVFPDLKKLVRYTDKSRILFGSDYPYGSPAGQLAVLVEVLAALDVSHEDRDRILYRNAASLFAKEKV